MINTDLKCPKFLCEKYEQVLLLGWTPAKIAMFLQAQLLVGVVKSRNRPCMIREKSFVRLLNYSRNLSDINNVLLDPKGRGTINLMTPMELYEAYPRVQLNSWTAASIGMYLNCKLLLGVYKGSGRSSIIAESSFIKLIEYSNSVLEWKKVYV